MFVKTIPIPVMRLLQWLNMAVILPMPHNDQMAVLQIWGKFFTFVKIRKNFVLL